METTSTRALRLAAEKQMKLKKLEAPSVLNEADAFAMIHELSVTKIELEMQNEELLMAKEEIYAANLKLKEQFDFAPSGQAVLSKDGAFIKLNFAAANMIGKERSFLRRKLLSSFVSNDTRPVFNSFIHNLFLFNTKQSCEIKLGALNTHVQLEGNSTENKEELSITLIDITERKKIEEFLRVEAERENDTMNLFIGREHKMIELKKEVNDLLKKLGEEKKYDY